MVRARVWSLVVCQDSVSAWRQVLGLEPRLPVDRNLLYSDRVSEFREAYPVRRRIRTHQAWKQLVQRLLRHFGARQEPGPSGVGERIFARRRCGETAGWSLSSGTMLNTSHDKPVELM